MNQEIGNPTYNQGKKNIFRLKDGDNIYRILPPFGSFARDGRWAVFYSIHWGYKSSKGARTFCCIQKKNPKTKMVTFPCPECDNVAEKKREYDNQFKTLTEVQKMPPDKAKEFLKPLSEYLFNHNLDKKWWMNVMAPDGSIGRLGIPHKSYQSLQLEISRLISGAKPIDPIAVNKGVYFNFNRTGIGNKTNHSVSVVRESIIVEGEQLERTKIVPLTEEVLNKMKSEAWDLGSLFKQISFDEMSSIVNSGGEVEAVDAIFNAKQSSDEDEPSSSELDSAVVSTEQQQKPVVENVPVVEPVVAASEVDEMAQLEARLATLKKQKTENVPVVENPVETTVAQSVSPTVSTMSNAEFMARFGKKKQ